MSTSALTVISLDDPLYLDTLIAILTSTTAFISFIVAVYSILFIYNREKRSSAIESKSLKKFIREGR